MNSFKKSDLWTIPNILGYFRILLIPVFITLYFKEYYLIAGILVLLSSFTDLFDGYIARRFNQVTTLGKVLDPIADKLTHFALGFSIALNYPLMWILIALMILKEGFMGIMGLIAIKKGYQIEGAKWYGKVCTAALFIGLLIIFMFGNIKDIYINLIMSVLIIIMTFTLIMYIIYYAKLIKRNFKN